MNIMQKYYNKLRSEILPIIPKPIVSLLDVGCGEGITAEYIKKNYQIETVEGMELNDEAYELAAKKLDKVYKIDLNLPGNPFANITKKYDCILFLDVLEHLIDPYKILELSKNILNNNGRVIISLPNIRHYTSTFPLLFKNEWEYQDQGVLDKTHLRFFTLKSSIRLIEGAGFEVLKTAKNYSYYRGFKILNLLFLGILTPFSISQYIFVCRIKCNSIIAA